MIAALFVASGGVYFDVSVVDPWDAARDARTYAGPLPVVAHPPCERWGRAATIGGRRRGDDGGCFAAALSAVRRFGGVLEHPEGSGAWPAHGLARPPRAGGWVQAGDGIGWTCCVEQGHYGHRARKATWLYAAQVKLPALQWGPATVPPIRRLREARTEAERRRAIKTGVVQNLSAKQRAATPMRFRELLISIALTAPRDPSRIAT